MLELNVSKISNVIAFNVDKASMAEAKKAAADLQKYFAKIQDPKIRFKTFKQNQRRAEALSDDAKLKNAVKSSESKQQRIADKAAKTQAREQAKIAKRNETADIKFKSAGLQLRGIAGKYGVDPAKQYEALKFIQEQTELFRKGVLSSQRMNFTIRERITDLRREAALQAKITASTQAQAAAQRTAKRTDYKGAAANIKEKGLNVIGGGPGFIAATAAFAGGAALLGRIRDTANDNLDLVRKSASVHVNPNAVKAIVTANRQRGIDSNYDTVTDNFKDVRERLGESVTNSQMDQKTGKWKGGNGAIDNIMNLFGWNKQQIAKYQDNPLDFVQAVSNEGQRRGMSDAALGHLLEDLGNDMSYLVPVLKNNGEEFNTTLKHLVSSGQTLNDEQIKQTYAYGDLATTMQALNNGINQNLTSGFLDGFGNAGKDLASNTDALNEVAKGLGWELGNLLAQVTGFTKDISDDLSKFNGWMKETFPSLFTDPDKPATQVLYDNAVNDSANTTADFIQQKTGFDTRSVGPAIMDWLGVGGANAGTAANQYSLNGDSLRGSAMSLTSGNAPAYNLAPVFNLTVAPQVPLTIQSDASRLADYVDFQARASQASFMQSLTLSALSGQSSTGG
ncbi:OmpH family outer membrane protein [Enterobacter hormaechei]|uniref:OmpH family outer membrane protein n=1 Tax=Enterobacter hormaechei TaxID=158836 RepID=UPI0006665EDA|nr:OmpH family outer membrane protein [Enterobacter hormaechei]